jgi:hypothetical protein
MWQLCQWRERCPAEWSCINFIHYLFDVQVGRSLVNEYIALLWNEDEVPFSVCFIFYCRTLHNYMVWHVLKMMSSYLSKPFQDAKKEFLKILSGLLNDMQITWSLDFPVKIHIVVLLQLFQTVNSQYLDRWCGNERELFELKSPNRTSVTMIIRSWCQHAMQWDYLDLT